MKLRHILYFASLLIFVTACTCNRSSRQPKKEQEVKKSKIRVEILRFEKAWFAMDPANLPNELKKIQKTYPRPYEAFYNFVMEFPRFGSQEQQLMVIRDFITKKDMRNLYDTVMLKYPDLDFLESELQVAFANYKSYFPEKPVPQVFTCITEFAGFQAFTFGDSILGLCIDDHLGPKYLYYKNFFYDYQLYGLDKKFMSVHAMNVMATNIIDAPDARSTLLDKMIAYGKILYFIQSMLPDKSPKDVMEYDDKQWKWCVDNERQIWGYFLEKKLLYDTRPDNIRYVEEGPSTYGMPKESPGKAGAWLGWQIVRAYMKENPGTTLKQLIALKDGQKLLEGSKYKPRD
jgi:hypothetical protein